MLHEPQSPDVETIRIRSILSGRAGRETFPMTTAATPSDTRHCPWKPLERLMRKAPTEHATCYYDQAKRCVFLQGPQEASPNFTSLDPPLFPIPWQVIPRLWRTAWTFHGSEHQTYFDNNGTTSFCRAAQEAFSNCKALVPRPLPTWRRFTPRPM
jgi:hypothetical protein